MSVAKNDRIEDGRYDTAGRWVGKRRSDHPACRLVLLSGQCRHARASQVVKRAAMSLICRRGASVIYVTHYTGAVATLASRSGAASAYDRSRETEVLDCKASDSRISKIPPHTSIKCFGTVQQKTPPHTSQRPIPPRQAQYWLPPIVRTLIASTPTPNSKSSRPPPPAPIQPSIP
jgi:hypothetical protein